jgi:D-glycero-alpha-D-manno-heptose 1-phosphate guanylyltransferase
MQTSPDEITALILAGGLGTRLSAVLPDTPKTLAMVNGEPFIFRLLEQVHRAGITSAILCIGHLGDQVEQTLGTHYREVRLAYSRDLAAASSLLGTGGALRLAGSLCPSHTLLALNGDSFFGIDLGGLLRTHTAFSAEATIALAQLGERARYGSVEIDKDQHITRFSEKGAFTKGWTNAGIYVLERQLLEEIPFGLPSSLERDCFTRWTERRFFGYPVEDAFFIDIGTVASLSAAQATLPISRETLLV